MALQEKLEKEINKLLKAKWKARKGEEIYGNGWAVSITREESNYPVIGPKQKKTHLLAIAMDKNGNIVEKQFEARSRSWVDNCHQIFPNVNIWVYMMNGEKPDLH